MTGPYDETEQRHDGHWNPAALDEPSGGRPAQQPAAAEPANGEHGTGQGNGSWPSADQPTVRAYPVDPASSGAHPAATSAPTGGAQPPGHTDGHAGYVDPSQPGGYPMGGVHPGYVDPSQSGGHPVDGMHPGYVDPSQSAGHPVDGMHPGYVDPSQSGSHPVDGVRPGYVDPGQPGGYPVDSQHGAGYVDPSQSGGYPVDPASGGFPVPGQVAGGPSGPYRVGGGHSGPFHVDPTTGQPYPRPGYPAPDGRAADGRQPSPPSQELSTQHLIKQTKRPPQSGWRRAVFVASGRSVNLGESPADLQRRELIARINQPLRGCYKIAMLSLKGGVGKTTTTTTLGSTFSSLRGDRVIAVDANPDRGTLSQKIPLETTATVRHLLRDADRIRRYSDVRSYTSQGPSRLEVLASEQDPAVSEAFSDSDYLRTIDLLEHFYNIVLTDCGTGLMHSAMKGVLNQADSLVVVSSGSADGARSASATLDWLDAHGYRDLVGRSVAVINSVRPRSGKVDVEKLVSHFGARCRAVCQIPFDTHLEEGAEIELDRLQPATRLALLELAAVVADDFPQASLRGR